MSAPFAAVGAGGGGREEEALLRAAQSGSAEAREELARRYWDAAYRGAYLVVQDRAAAEDIAQEAILAALGRIDRFDRRRPFGPWLHRIVVNRSIDWVRARARRGEVSDDGVAELEDPGAPNGERLPDDLVAALTALDPEDRAVVVLRHVFGYDSTEIARMLGVPPATVRTRLRRALGRLRPLLAGRGLAVAVLAAIVAVALVTPPGRAALDGAAELIGQIGGAPASPEDSHFEPTVPPGQPGSPVVVDNGEAPDGSRYEWVAFRLTKQLGPRSRQPTHELFCVRFGWADVSRRARTGGCSSLGGWSPGVVHLTGRLARPARRGGPRPYLVLGEVDPRVGRLRLFYRRPGGVAQELAVDHARVEGDLLRRAGGTDPFAVFAAFVPGEAVAADRLGARHRPMSLALVDPAFQMPLPYSVRYKHCVRRHGGFFDRGWIDVAIYDRRDRHVATLPTRTARRPPAACESIRRADGDVRHSGRPIESPLRTKLLRAFPPRHPR